MKSQLEQQNHPETFRSNSEDACLEAEFMGAKQSKGADMKHREALRKLEKEKREQQEVQYNYCIKWIGMGNANSGELSCPSL